MTATWSPDELERIGSAKVGHVLDSRRARIRVPGLEADVAVADVGEGTAQLRADIDAAYRTKYGPYGSSSVEAMVAEAAEVATLELSRE